MRKFDPIEYRNYNTHKTTGFYSRKNMFNTAFNIAQSGAQSIKVISDDTDVFVRVMHFCTEQKLRCRLIMEATSS